MGKGLLLALSVKRWIVVGDLRSLVVVACMMLVGMLVEMPRMMTFLVLDERGRVTIAVGRAFFTALIAFAALSLSLRWKAKPPLLKE
jgi:heme/copper-type cytochrome/quinol oxidase subunit 4